MFLLTLTIIRAPLDLAKLLHLMLIPLHNLVHHLLHEARACLAVAVVGLMPLCMSAVENIPAAITTSPRDDVPFLFALTSSAVGLLGVPLAHCARLLNTTWQCAETIRKGCSSRWSSTWSALTSIGGSLRESTLVNYFSWRSVLLYQNEAAEPPCATRC